ncbi:MAG: deoxyribodipyrimidine photo-lyase [Roseivirga sp.]|jgi:deoxyribodipyrimidine photo-lyase
MKRGIYWFRNDLRVSDNEGLVRAIAENDEVLPLFIIDDRWLAKDQFGIERTGIYRLKFLLESLEDLKAELQKIGSDLRVISGDSMGVLLKTFREYDCTKVYAQRASSEQETKEEKNLSHEIPTEFIWGETLYHLDDLPMGIKDLPEIFTDFRKLAEKKSNIRPLIEAPTSIRTPQDFGTAVPSLNSFGFNNSLEEFRAPLDFKGGANAANDRIQYYFWDKELLSDYKNTRNGLLGSDFSSHLSPWLSNGCISPREIYWQIVHYEKYVKKNSSTYWLVFELIWRDYFHFVALKHGKKIFLRTGIHGVDKVEWGPDRLFHLWRDGKTKEPFIDANMRELNATGFMSNRGRQIVASYLIHQMKIDWRIGAAYFEKMLIDYDPCSNYGNWAYIAGVGNDPRGGREFNIAKQKETFDPKGKYQEYWN